MNGRPVSGVQRRLAEALGGELNHRVGRRSIDVALEREGVLIAVEYDSWFYHGHPLVQAYDDARADALIALGWRVLRIRGAYTLPSQDELDAALAWLVAGEERVVITTPEWGVGPFRDAEFAPERRPRPYRRRHGGPVPDAILREPALDSTGVPGASPGRRGAQACPPSPRCDA